MPAELMRRQAMLINLARESRSPGEFLQLARAAIPGLSNEELRGVINLTADLPGVRRGSLGLLLRDASKLTDADDPGP